MEKDSNENPNERVALATLFGEVFGARSNRRGESRRVRLDEERFVVGGCFGSGRSGGEPEIHAGRADGTRLVCLFVDALVAEQHATVDARHDVRLRHEPLDHVVCVGDLTLCGGWCTLLCYCDYSMWLSSEHRRLQSNVWMSMKLNSYAYIKHRALELGKLRK